MYILIQYIYVSNECVIINLHFFPKHKKPNFLCSFSREMLVDALTD